MLQCSIEFSKNTAAAFGFNRLYCFMMTTKVAVSLEKERKAFTAQDNTTQLRFYRLFPA
jgi:hypothetical protein